MRYFVGLVVFSGIGAFLIADTIDFYRELKNNPPNLSSDLFRLLILGGMTAIGYLVATKTFHQSTDWLVFLVIGIIAAFLIYILKIKKAQ